ncbi:MAG: DUF2280 domain-containing protein [Salinisphaeraceae bacterium]
MAARKRGKLKDEHRHFVVQRLACFDTPKEVAEALRDEHGVEISPQSVEAYDPNKRAGRDLAQKWRDLFEKTRADFQDNLEKYVPEASKVVRVRHLAHAARAFKGRGNYVGMADMMERIAKEVGNVHTNRRELTGKDGGPIKTAHSDLTDDQLDERLAKIMGALAGPSDAAADAATD